MIVLIASKSDEQSRLCSYRFDERAGRLESLGRELNVPGAMFFARHPSQPVLYCSHHATEGGDLPGQVAAYRLDEQGPTAESLGQALTQGKSPCYLHPLPQRGLLLYANYTGSPRGSVGAIALNEDGSLGQPIAHHQHEGSGPHKRQKESHPHSFRADEAARFAYAPDLGTDRVTCYELSGPPGAIQPRPEKDLPLPGGSGPRHLAFHPDGRWVYIVTELSNEVIACDRDPQTGVLEAMQTISTLPADFEGESYAAEVRVHPNGRLLLATNRNGDDSVVVYDIAPRSGQLSWRDRYPTGGVHPRHCQFSPDGRWLFLTNTLSGEAMVWRCDEDGTLSETHRFELPQAGCVDLI